MTAAIEVNGGVKRYGPKTAVDHVDLTLQAGRITCLLGPSGCGKSTLLRLIAGLESLDGGTIEADGHDITRLPPEQRDIGLVFQDYALFPHLRVEDNVGFGLKSMPAAQRKARVQELLGGVQLADRARSFPGELSGGEQQRVALVRALARSPHTVLLDEPFSGLDSHLKGAVRDATLGMLRASGAAVMLVTHDAEEAMQMADDLALMSEGRILQRGTPEDCYRNPVSIDAARLLGEAQVIPALIRNGVAETAFGSIPAEGEPDGKGQVMLRADALITGGGVPVAVTESRFVGQGWHTQLSADGVSVSVRLPDQPDGQLQVRLDPQRVQVFHQS